MCFAGSSNCKLYVCRELAYNEYVTRICFGPLNKAEDTEWDRGSDETIAVFLNGEPQVPVNGKTTYVGW